MATETDIVINPDRFKNYFNNLETHKTLLTTITDLHKSLTTHFTSLHEALTQKSQALDSKIESFKSSTQETLESLQNRENAIPTTESSLASRIDELKKASVSDIENKSYENEEDGKDDKSLSAVLRMYFRRMDSCGLMRFLLAKRKESVALRTEMALAVEEAVDLFRFVVEAVEEFVELKIEGKVGGMADRRWACGMLIQAGLPVEQPRSGVSTSLKERASLVLEKWKGVLGGGEGSGGVGAGEATMFLQMVIGFGIKDKFDEEFLKKLVLEFASRRDMAKLAVALGFGEKMGDIIDEFVKSRKEIEAVYFAIEAGLTERFPPVTLLRSYLKNCRNTASAISKIGRYSSPSVEEANNSELIATRAIIKCVEDHKLESEFTTDNLKKRVAQLEKAKADSKKKGGASTSNHKPSNKRSHGGGSSSGRGAGGGSTSFRPPKAARFSSNASAAAFRQRPNPAPVSAARYSSPYSYPSPSVYESSPAAAATYAVGYAGGAPIQSPAGVPPQQYSYPPQDIGIGGARVAGSYGGQSSYAAGQSNYSAYDYGAAPAAPTYPTTYKL